MNLDNAHVTSTEVITVQVKVKPIEPAKLKKGMLVMWGNDLLQINGKEHDMWLLGTEHVNVTLEPEFYPSTKRRVFQPVVLVSNT